MQPRIFALDHGLFKEGMRLNDTHQISRSDFEELGRRIGLPDRIIQRELKLFETEQPKMKRLIANSFLSDALKQQYELSIRFRQQMLTF